MSTGDFYTPEGIKSLYDELVPAYQQAFAGSPWNEASKCPDVMSRCVGGLSAISVGAMCQVCSLCPVLAAYPADELTARFEKTTVDRAASWYIEKNENGLALAALGWKAKPSEIATEKYADVPAMEAWIKGRFRTPYQQLRSRFGLRVKESDIIWLDEVFANRQVRPNGNLRNFGNFVVGLAEILDAELVAYRTIEPRMIRAAQRDFGAKAQVYEPGIDVPDRRNFVIIDTMVTEAIWVPASDAAMIATNRSRRKVVNQDLAP